MQFVELRCTGVRRHANERPVWGALKSNSISTISTSAQDNCSQVVVNHVLCPSLRDVGMVICLKTLATEDIQRHLHIVLKNRRHTEKA